MSRTFRLRRGVIIGCVVLLAQLIIAAVSTEEHSVTNITVRPVIGSDDAASTNCTPAAIEEFPKPLLNSHQRKQGWLAVHIVVAIYMLVSLSTLCENYFVPAIEVLTETLEIDPDVAGATFMAAASSVPAIAASIIAILVSEGDLGVSTALGSAVLNAAGVVSVSALFAGKVVTLHRWPMYRDSMFFLISVAIMLVAMFDDLITWYEAAILVAVYFIYAIFMSFDATMERFFVKNLKFLQDRVEYPEGMFPAQAQVEDTSVPVPTTVSTAEFDPPSPGYKTNERSVSTATFRKSIVGGPPTVRVKIDAQRRRLSLISLKRSIVVNERNRIITGAAADGRSPSLGSVGGFHGVTLSPPESHFLKIFWLLYLPFSVLFHYTIPDCQREEKRKYFVFTFIMSTLHIAVASYLLVWMITIIGFTLSISDTVMGLTFLAIGVTLPDIVSSLLVVRKGLGDMAVCTALGSNIFEVLVGLGLPWLIKTSIMKPGEPIVVASRGMLYSTVSLFATLIFLIALTHWNKWRMNRKYGAILMAWYMIFLALSSAYELGVFGGIKLPTCEIDF